MLASYLTFLHHRPLLPPTLLLGLFFDVYVCRFATAEACAFMVENTNGILCAPLSEGECWCVVGCCVPLTALSVAKWRLQFASEHLTAILLDLVLCGRWQTKCGARVECRGLQRLLCKSYTPSSLPPPPLPSTLLFRIPLQTMQSGSNWGQWWWTTRTGTELPLPSR